MQRHVARWRLRRPRPLVFVEAGDRGGQRLDPFEVAGQDLGRRQVLHAVDQRRRG